MPTIKRLMDAAIVGMVVVDLVLTGMLLVKSHHPSDQANRQASAGSGDLSSSAKSETATYPTTSAMDVSSALTLINTDGFRPGDPSNASALRNWADWNVASDSQPIHTYYQNLSPASRGAIDPVDERQDVSAAMFLLLRAGTSTSEVFSCPTTQPTKWDYGAGANGDQNWTVWSSTTSTTLVNLSYSYENPYPASQRSVGVSSTKP
jgi:hypothetical protein